MTDLINPHEMEVCKVASASWSVNSLETMGTLVSKGILIKEYVSTGIPDAHEIHWTNVSEKVIVENGYETIKPGETVIWEK
jgi:hypothetical protein|tara:strand:+ start:181 stop:423 length:243 start_codon:yes stop_codon:yes gene_type:complete